MVIHQNRPVIRLSLFVLITMLFACGSDEIAPVSINPTTQPDAFSRALVIRGATLKKGLVSTEKVDALLRIEKSQPSASVTSNNSLFMPFVFSSGTGRRVKGVYLTVAGADTHWDIPVQPIGTGQQALVINLGIPASVTPGKFTVSYQLYDESMAMSNTVELDGEIVPTEEVCQNGGSTLGKVEGNDGITVRSFQLGNQPGWVTINFNTFSVPDRIDIQYGGQWVRSTGTLLTAGQLPPIRQCSQVSKTEGFVGRTGQFNIYYDPKVGRQIDVYVSGCLDGGTKWEFEVTDCPSQRPMLGIHSSEPPTNCKFDCNNFGHAWISLTDNGKTTYYGLWPDWNAEVKNRNLANGAGSDVRVNIESGSGEINRYYLLKPDQLKRLEAALLQSRIYSLLNYNCSSFASDMVFQAVGERVNPIGGLSGRPTPCTLSESIVNLNVSRPTDVNYSPIGIKFSRFNRIFCE